jgi:hypothetical protein
MIFILRNRRPSFVFCKINLPRYNFFPDYKSPDITFFGPPNLKCLVRLAYQPPVSSTFLSEQTSHSQPANNTFPSEQISTSHQPPAKGTSAR